MKRFILTTLIMLQIGLSFSAISKKDRLTTINGSLYSFSLHKSAPQTRCTAAGCLYFLQIVPSNHVHWFHCMGPTCIYFLQYVPQPHKHVYRK